MKPFILLNQRNLESLPGSIARPGYDRSKLKAGIMHIGVGGFHRSHEAYYTDALLEKTGTTEWGICGVGLRAADGKIAEVLKSQDYLYTLIIKHPDGTIETRVIGSIIDFLLGCDDPAGVIDRMAEPTTKIVSLTITEGGYNFDPATGAFDFRNPDVKHDLKNPDCPKTVFGFLTAALRKRRANGLPPFTIQSCDNIEHNGDMTRNMLTAFARKADQELCIWIENEVGFPNAMVDRITPVTTPVDVKSLEEDFGVKDEWPVTCEPFCQWVIEDKFSDERPHWETVGAQFVENVTPYETMKLRLLNAGHSVLGLLGSIHGHTTVNDCIADPLFKTYLRRYMDVEASPVLDPVEGIDLGEYKATLIERFGNPAIKDSLARICLESSAKIPKFILPTIRENIARKGSTEFAALVLAAWCYYIDKGTDKDGNKLDIVDAMKSELHQAAARTAKDKLAFLKFRPVFGDLAENKSFAAEYIRMVDELYSHPPGISLLMQALLFGRE